MIRHYNCVPRRNNNAPWIFILKKLFYNKNGYQEVTRKALILRVLPKQNTFVLKGLCSPTHMQDVIVQFPRITLKFYTNSRSFRRGEKLNSIDRHVIILIIVIFILLLATKREILNTVQTNRKVTSFASLRPLTQYDNTLRHP